MISCDFAPNENWDDAWLSFKLLFQPWRWLKGKELKKVKKQILSQLLITNYKLRIFFFLTGRSALYTILKALCLPPGSEVIVQAFTCEAVILPILKNNLKPIYVDIEPNNFSINPIDLQKKISDKTKVIILQHTFGIPPIHLEKIKTISEKYNILLIEDIAHGYNNQKIKNQKSKVKNSVFLFSFGRSKALSSVFGAAIATNNNQIIKQLKHYQASLNMPSLGFIFRLLLYKPISMLIKVTYDIYIGKLIHKLINLIRLIPPEISGKEKRGEYDFLLNKAYPNALAILLCHQLKKYDQMQKHRALICNLYSQKISNFQFLISKQLSNIQYPISNIPLIRYPLLVSKRDLILEETAKNNIFLGNWYNQVVAPKSVDLKKMQYKKGSCPTAEKVCQKIVNLPTNIRQKDVNIIMKDIKFFESGCLSAPRIT